MTYPNDVLEAEPNVLAATRARLVRRFKVVLRDRGRTSKGEPELDLGDSLPFLRRLYHGSPDAWYARQEKMFAVLKAHVARRERDDLKVIVWAHNADVGDALATSFSGRGGVSLGQLCRQHYGEGARLVGFGVAQGTLTAADRWGGPGRPTALQEACGESYEALGRQAGMPAFILSLREPAHPDIREAMSGARLQRAVGPVYQPSTERASHYFQAALADQFDEYVWFREGHAITPVVG